tara:strand:+ start:144 stop:545 length:402 start_codon:yes stop_codon:yes gene_type:complete
MKFNIDSLSDKLKNLSNELNIEEKNLKKLIQKVSLKDDTKQSYDVLYEILTDEEKHYHLMNEEYKSFISGYSQEYREMSDWYYGPELPYDIYCKLFYKDTYLNDKKGIEKLYSLFIFMTLFEYEMNKYTNLLI